MSNYLVTWQLNFEADSEEEAAALALEEMRMASASDLTVEES